MAVLLSTYRDRVKLHENGYLYVFDKMSTNGEKKFWRCERKSECNARVHTDAVTNQVVKRSSVHNHPSNPYIVQRCGILAVSNNWSRDSAASSGETSKLYGELSSLGVQMKQPPQEQPESHINGSLSVNEIIDSLLQKTQKGLTDENGKYATINGKTTTVSSRKRRRDAGRGSVTKDDGAQSVCKDQNNIASTSEVGLDFVKTETSDSQKNNSNSRVASDASEVPEEINVTAAVTTANICPQPPLNKRSSKTSRSTMACDCIDRLLTGSFIKWSPKVNEIIKLGEMLVNTVLQNDRTLCTSLLITGAVNCGKTYLAARIAKLSETPVIKACLPDDFVGCSETAKVSALCKVFEEVYKSSVGIIVLDSIDRLIDYCNVGNQFSNMVLQTLYVLLKKTPPPGHRLLIIGTSEENCTKLFQLKKQFSFSADVPSLTTVDDLMAVIKGVNTLDDNQLTELRQRIVNDLPKFSFGVKRILDILEICKQRDSVERVTFICQLLEGFAKC